MVVASVLNVYRLFFLLFSKQYGIIAIYIAFTFLSIISNLEMISNIQDNLCRLYTNVPFYIRSTMDFGILRELVAGSLKDTEG